MPKFALRLDETTQKDGRPLYYSQDMNDGADLWDFDLLAAKWFGSIAEAIEKAKTIDGAAKSKFKKREKIYVIDEQRTIIRTFKR